LSHLDAFDYDTGFIVQIKCIVTGEKYLGQGKILSMAMPNYKNVQSYEVACLRELFFDYYPLEYRYLERNLDEP